MRVVLAAVGEGGVDDPAGVQRGVQADHVVSVIGPIGMPNAVAALSMARGFAPSSSSTSDSFRYGNRMRLTRKPGQSRTTIGVLPMLLGQGDQRDDRGVAGLLAADHLDQLHAIHRIEEVHARRSSPDSLDRLGHARDRDRRGVRRQDRVRAQDRLQLRGRAWSWPPRSRRSPR